MSTTTWNFNPTDPEHVDVTLDQKYRRGVHQALSAASTWIEKCSTLDQARELLRRAELEAASIRASPKRCPQLLDHLRERILPPCQPEEPPP